MNVTQLHVRSYDREMTVKDVICFVALIKIKLLYIVLVLVFKSDYMIRRANRIFQWASVVTCKNQNSSYRGKFSTRETNRNSVRLSGEFELSESELTE